MLSRAWWPSRALRARSALPTFLYAMPFSPTRVFLEETSLVARPAVGFAELRARLRARLAHLGVVVTAVEEEECCLIPMGGVLPRLPQRVLGIGGTAGMVHPSTGALLPCASCAPALCKGSVLIQGTGSPQCRRAACGCCSAPSALSACCTGAHASLRRALNRAWR